MKSRGVINLKSLTLSLSHTFPYTAAHFYFYVSSPHTARRCPEMGVSVLGEVRESHNVIITSHNVITTSHNVITTSHNVITT